MPDTVAEVPATSAPSSTPDYRRYSEIAGPLTVPAADGQTVQFRRRLSPVHRAMLAALILLNATTSTVFFVWLLLPSHFPAQGWVAGLGDALTGGVWFILHVCHALWQIGAHTALRLWPALVRVLAPALAVLGFLLIVGIELIRLGNSAVLWLFAWMMRDPVPMTPAPGLRVAVLTTIVPSSEPLEMVARTLRAMRRIQYDGSVDVWILDEGDDPEVRRVARALGVHHFSRKGRPEYNQPSGPFKARTKAGNHNAWRAEHEHEYDVVAQMDPDHVPGLDFLTRTLGYFRDPDVAFVVAPQVYGNLKESFVTLGAADQSYLFHGVIQRGANGLDAPLLIGTNHLYRTTAMRQIGGYQDSVIEDHLTSLRLHVTTNPRTGRPWKGVYTPDILSVGEGPRTWTDYFNQQQRWAYGIWDVVLKHSPKLLPRLSLRRRLSYIGLQLFYPGLGFTWVAGNLLTALYLLFGITVIRINVVTWLLLWGGTSVGQLLLFVWLRRFNLAQHERKGCGASGMLLSLATGPVYVAAGVAAVLRKPLAYIVTAKGRSATSDSWMTFRLHAWWLAGMLALLAVSVAAGHGHLPLRGWALFTLAAVLFPMAMFWVHQWRPVPAAARRRAPRLARPASLGVMVVIALLAVNWAAMRAQARPSARTPVQAVPPVGSVPAPEDTARSLHTTPTASIAGIPSALQVRTAAAQDEDRALRCVAFGPYVGDLDPAAGRHPSPAVIDTLLDVVVNRTGFRCIMTYSVRESFAYTVQAAAARGLEVIAVLWLDTDQSYNDASIDQGIQLAKAHPQTIIRLSCGSELRTRHGLTTDHMVRGCITRLRAAGVAQPITSIDTWWEWCARSWPCRRTDLADVVDWIGVNVFPWWENRDSGLFPCVGAADAAAFHIARLQDVTATYSGKETVLTEFGWPAGPDGYTETNRYTGQACGAASEDNQRRVLAETMAELDRLALPGVVFEAFRQGDWKARAEGPGAVFWGLCEGTPPYACRWR